MVKMGNLVFTAEDFGKKPYAKPEMELTEIRKVGIICASARVSDDYLTGDTSDWF